MDPPPQSPRPDVGETVGGNETTASGPTRPPPKTLTEGMPMTWTPGKPKHVPSHVRRAVLARDGYQCTAIGREGQRCPQGVNLEAHHVTGYTPGETTTPDMLTTLCSWHHNRITQQQARQARLNNPTPGVRRPPEPHPGLR